MPTVTDATAPIPALSIVTPTFNNEAVLRRSLEAWERFGGDRIEVIVVEDGCHDGTADYLREQAGTLWGRTHLRWLHEDDAHELRCTNRGFSIARAPLVAAWQDDMFVEAGWFVPELLAQFDAYSDLGMLVLSRGLTLHPCTDPLERWEDTFDWRRLRSTIGARPWNWVRLQEVDAVIRPWVVRRDCLERVGMLDEAFRPTEWDEADLAFRIRDAGWRIAAHGYERLGAYSHLGSTTIGSPTEKYKAGALRNARIFHERWDATIARTHQRPRRTWMRKPTLAGWLATASAVLRRAGQRTPA